MEATGLRVDRGSIVIDAAASEIYAAFTNAEALTAWLPPGDMRARALEYDFRTGGRYRLELTYPESAAADAGKTTGRTDVSAGRFLVLEPSRRIVQTVEFESAEAAFSGQMTLTWTFESLVTGTRVIITAENVPPGIKKADHDAGLQSSLQNLKRYLASRRAPASP